MASEQIAARTGMSKDETLAGLIGLYDAGFMKLVADNETMGLRPCFEDGTIVEQMEGFRFRIG